MITAKELRSIPLFADLPDDEADTLTSHLADVHLRPGDTLLHEGEQPSFFLILEGALEVCKMVHGVERRVDFRRSGSYFGELSLLLGSPAIASVRAVDASRVAQLGQDDFSAIFHDCEIFRSEISRSVTRTFANLRTLAEEPLPPAITIVGHPYDIACHDLRDFAARNHITFAWQDLTRGRGEGGYEPQPGDQFPLVELPDGSRLMTPTLREFAEKLGLATRPKDAAYDVAIVGGGPAGLASAVYGASEGLRTVLVEVEAPGGQAGTSSRIENYLGFPTGVSGDELGSRALRQAKRFGAELLVAREAVAIEPGAAGEDHVLVLDGEERVRARTIIVATGVSWRELELPGANALVGRGIFYGAARTEAQGCQGQHVFLVGGGNSAGQAAMFFSGYAQKVSLLVRGAGLADTMSHYLIEQLKTKDNVEICTRCRIVKTNGENRLESIVIEDRDTGKLRTEGASAVFVFIGADAETAWLPDVLIRDDKGYVCTGRDVMDLVHANHGGWPLDRDPYLLETSVPGIFSAGDVRHGSIKRVASGVGEGSMAIAFVHQYLASLEKVATPA
jgi:thioredoxin reductase (NADPH)